MPLRFFGTSFTVSTPNTDAISVASNDDIYIAPGVVIAATGTGGSDGMDAVAASDVTVSVQGVLVSASDGIYFASFTGANTVTVGTTGQVISGGGSAIYLDGARGMLLNEGLVQTLTGGSSGGAFCMFSNATETVMTNHGRIIGGPGAAAVVTGSGCQTATLVNTGLIDSSAAVPTGSLFRSAYYGGGAVDIVWNTGRMIGDVTLQSGDDVYQGGGRVFGSIDGGAGNDTIIGGSFDDTIGDGLGRNFIAGGDGADTITIGNGANDFQTDIVIGGISGGPDTSLNDTIAFTESEVGIGVNVFLGAGYVESQQADRPLVAVISGIENAIGAGHNDAIIGSEVANLIDGGFGNDWLIGNGGADTFRFSNAFDASGDNIRDFSRTEGDRIDLSRIDANTTIAGDQAFVIVSVHGNTAAGQLVVTNFGNSALVEMYTNADNFVDGTFVVVFDDPAMTGLQLSDFIL